MKCIENSKENIGTAVRALKEGGVIAHPADTCYGLAGDLMNKNALERLQQIKGRDSDKPMSAMFPAYMKSELEDYVLLDHFSEMVCDKLLPGPVTIVLPKGPKIPDYFFPEIETVGVRIPYDTLTNDLLTRFHGPLITTSANLSDRPVCCSCEDVRNSFEGKKNQPDLLLEGGMIKNMCMPSTVIRVKEDSVEILRDGPIKKEQMEAILGISI
jgi:L-threonylcarbamoyladenylate synthase